MHRKLIYMEKKFNNLPNKPYTSIEDGKVRHHSRSIAICGMIILIDEIDHKTYLLIHSRGEGCPDEKGKWSFNCGYLDWNETLIDGLKRELWEEIGLDVDKLKTCTIKLDKINDSIEGENKIKQNVTIQYHIICDFSEIKSLFDSGILNNKSEERGGEPREVEEIKIFKLEEKFDPSKWAFNHGELVNDLYEHFYGNSK